MWLYSLICVGPVGIPEDKFSHDEAQIVQSVLKLKKDRRKSSLKPSSCTLNSIGRCDAQRNLVVTIYVSVYCNFYAVVC